MKKGLTLIEVLVATVIFSLISLILCSLLHTGIAVRDKISGKLTVHQNVYINLERTAKELRNVVFFKEEESGFKGYEDEDNKEQFLEFYTLTFDYLISRPKILRVVYRFNQDKEILYRTVYEPFNEQPKQEESEFLQGLEQFELYYFDAAMSSKDKWEAKIPQGVQIKLAYKEKDSEVLTDLNKFVYIYRDGGYD
ncbi:MAG: type II secretion system protein GspJ [Candidatus Omnitrophota bacterium]